LTLRLGRSVKYKDIYLKCFFTIGELIIGLITYFAFYNEGRSHYSLANKTPDAMYQTASGGSAKQFRVNWNLKLKL
jgi:putative transposase